MAYNSGVNTVVGLSIAIFILVMLVPLFFLPSTISYRLFENKDGKIWAEGTLTDALSVVEKIHSNKDFRWIGDKLGRANREVNGKVDSDNFSEYDIHYKGVSMSLSYKDYRKYKKYLNNLYKKDQATTSKVSTSWAD